MAGGAHKPIVVYGALAANFAIAVTKFAVAGFTGSSAMLSEGIHSVADTGNQGLLLLGLHRSEKPPDPMHPFGHGKELYFWGLIVAMVLFGLGGGLSAYEGITHILHPTPATDFAWSLGVLGISALFEGAAWIIALRAILKTKEPDESLWTAVRLSKDPSIYTVLAEDTAALSGLLVAAVGITLAHVLEMPVLDGVASLIIGLILAAVALFLAYEARGLLIGESVDRDIIQGVRALAEGTAGIVSVERPITMQLGPHSMMLAMQVDFRDDLPVTLIPRKIADIKQAICEKYPDIDYVFLEADSFGNEARRAGDGVPDSGASSSHAPQQAPADRA